MSSAPSTEYRPPEKHLCDIDNWPVDVGEAIVQNAIWVYNKRIVHFSIATWLDDDELTRVDTCHGSIHRHTFGRRAAKNG